MVDLISIISNYKRYDILPTSETAKSLVSQHEDAQAFGLAYFTETLYHTEYVTCKEKVALECYLNRNTK